MPSPVLELKCAVQEYAWGKVGQNSEVFRLVTNQGAVLDDSHPYAELWMGTHKNGPSVAIVDGSEVPLSDVIASDPETYLGSKLVARFGSSGLPYLFKVLSVNKALSIQAHPDLELAKQLHATRPDVYKDPNHKPELAIALTPFEAMCGFRPVVDIFALVASNAELAALVGGTSFGNREVSNAAQLSAEEQKQWLRAKYAALMEQSEDEVSKQLELLVLRLSHVMNESPADLSAVEALVLRLSKDFPGDVGCFSAFFLNFKTLSPGDCMFLAANEPHAYLDGDCVECMANSDNVVRAGLTPKLKDVPTLVSMLTYNDAFRGQLDAADHEGDDGRLYAPPVDDFQVVNYAVSSVKECNAVNRGPSILLVTSGSGSLKHDVGEFQLSKGAVYFIAPGQQWTLASSESMNVYVASCNERCL